jgi:hypothetical protein
MVNRFSNFYQHEREAKLRLVSHNVHSAHLFLLFGGFVRTGTLLEHFVSMCGWRLSIVMYLPTYIILTVDQTTYVYKYLHIYVCQYIHSVDINIRIDLTYMISYGINNVIHIK